MLTHSTLNVLLLWLLFNSCVSEWYWYGSSRFRINTNLTIPEIRTTWDSSLLPPTSCFSCLQIVKKVTFPPDSLPNWSKWFPGTAAQGFVEVVRHLADSHRPMILDLESQPNLSIRQSSILSMSNDSILRTRKKTGPGKNHERSWKVMGGIWSESRFVYIFYMYRNIM